jgi:hypothetical protein
MAWAEPQAESHEAKRIGGALTHQLLQDDLERLLDLRIYRHECSHVLVNGILLFCPPLGC